MFLWVPLRLNMKSFHKATKKSYYELLSSQGASKVSLNSSDMLLSDPAQILAAAFFAKSFS